MERLIKKRKAARRWVTNLGEELEGILKKSSVSVVELKATIEQFDTRLYKLDEVQSEIELEMDDGDLDEDLDNAAEFRANSLIPRIKASEKLLELEVGQKDDEESTTTSANEPAAAQVRLPKLELPKFNGEVTEWQSFWDQFSSHVDNSDIPVISKFSYLASLLEGEAKSVISGLSHTSVNYKTACDLLKERFGRPERMIFAHVQALLNGKVPVKAGGPKYVSLLWNLQDELLTHIRSLEALGVSGKQCEVFLTPIILARLPSELRLEWARKGAGHESDLEWLLKFLQQEIETIERSETFKDVTSRNSEAPSVGLPDERRKCHSRGSRGKVVSTTSALHTSSEVDDYSICVFCKKKHKSEKCFEMLKLSGLERSEKIKSTGLCFKCLKQGHVAKGCFARCKKCNGNHNLLMCGIKLNSNRDNDPMKVAVENKSEIVNQGSSVNFKGAALHNVTSRNGTCTILQTAKVNVMGSNGIPIEVRALFDSGSDRTYVSSDIVRKCKPQWISSQPIAYSVFGGDNSSKSRQSNIYRLKVLGCDKLSHSLTAVEIPKICQPLIRPVVPNNLFNAFSHLQLADDYQNNSQVDIDILIGLDAYWQFIISGESLQVDGIVAQKSIFGWVLSGAWSANPFYPCTSSQMFCISKVSDYDVSKFWDL